MNTSKKSLKILQVITIGHPSGGAPINALLLRNELRKRGHEVKILSSDIKGEEMFSDYELKLIPKTSPWKAIHHLFYFRSYFLMKKIIKEFHPDIIHFHNIDAFSPSALFAIGTIPAVMTIHGPEEFTTKLLPWVLLPSDYKKNMFDLNDLTLVGFFRYWYYRLVQKTIYRMGMHRIKAFIAPSQYMANTIKKDVSPDKIRQIYNGIPLPPAKPPLNNHRLLYVGRLEEVKGVDFLIRAFAKVLIEIPDANLRIVGEGESRKNLERLAVDLGINRHITFCGWIKAGSEIIREYENTSLLIIPSVWPENLPTVCIEALAVGRPVIGTKTGGIPELIRDGETGYIVPIKDHLTMSQAIIGLLNDPQKLERMSKAATASIERFSIENFVDQIEALYKNISNENTYR